MSTQDYGKCVLFLTRCCGSFTSLIVLVCGFVTLLPIPTLTGGFSGYGRCIAVGLIMLATSVVMFFLEASVIGHCVDKLAFLLAINKYLKHWHRAVLYIGLSLVPLALWCVSTASIIGMGTIFLAGTINFVIAIGQKGNHSNTAYAKVEAGAGAAGEESEEEIHSKPAMLKTSSI
eukprot:Em0016g924a